MSNKVKEKTTEYLLRLKDTLSESFPHGRRVYITVAVALVVSLTMIYVQNLKAAYDKTRTRAELLSSENEILTEKIEKLDKELSETSDSLEIIEENYENLKEEINNLSEKLDAAEKDAADKQEFAEKTEDLENAIKDLIDTFGEANRSRSGKELYSSITKIDNAKDIIGVYLADNPKSEEYIALLDAEKKILEDRIKRYPDYEPCEGKVSQYFGNNSRFSGNKLVTTYHNGLDIYNLNKNVTISSAAYGTVVETQTTDQGGLGLYVKIDHGNGLSTLYAHLKEINVKVGQTVEKGQRIGVMGQTGAATGVHVHIEVFLNGNRTDPLNYMYPEYKR